MSEARLLELASEGAAAFDPEGFRFAERLVAVGLEARAEARLEKLSQELCAARASVDHAIAGLAARGIEIDPPLAAARASGDLRTALRMAARLDRNAGSQRRARWALTVASRAHVRGVRLPDDLARQVERLQRNPAAVTDAEASELGRTLSRELFMDSVASARATVAIARVAGAVPLESGPYNCHAIAARVLSEIDALSPGYARALVLALDDLAVLDGLPAPPKPKVSGRRKQ
jgi:hypothetical protein